MGSAHPPQDSSDGPSANAPPEPLDRSQATGGITSDALPQLVSQQELNAWRRGFTPQAEIWNGRLAMVGLSVGLTVLIVARFAHHS